MLKTISKSAQKDSDILWNFTKFLISRDGTRVQRFASTATPESFEEKIKELL
jgi:glutathione peroxidase